MFIFMSCGTGLRRRTGLGYGWDTYLARTRIYDSDNVYVYCPD